MRTPPRSHGHAAFPRRPFPLRPSLPLPLRSAGVFGPAPGRPAALRVGGGGRAGGGGGGVGGAGGGCARGGARPPVLVPRRLPQAALDRVEARCDMTLYEGDGAMPRGRLLVAVSGQAGAVTLLTDRVDDEFLDAAGAQLQGRAKYAGGFDNIHMDTVTTHP